MVHIYIMLVENILMVPSRDIDIYITVKDLTHIESIVYLVLGL